MLKGLDSPKEASNRLLYLQENDINSAHNFISNGMQFIHLIEKGSLREIHQFLSLATSVCKNTLI